MQVIGRGGGKRGQVFGAQWLLGVWQSRERRRAQWVCWKCCIRKLPLGEAESSLLRTALFVNSNCYQTSCHPVRELGACSDTSRRVSVNDSQVKWYEDGCRHLILMINYYHSGGENILTRSIFPFVVSVIWAIHKITQTLSVPVEAECSDCLHLHLQTSSRSGKMEFLDFRASPNSFFKEEDLAVVSQGQTNKRTFSSSPTDNGFL